MHIFEQKLVISFWKGKKLPIFCHKYFFKWKMWKKIGILGQKNSHFSLEKYLWQNIGSFSPFQKEITSFCSKMCIKWIFKIFVSKLSMDRRIVHRFGTSLFSHTRGISKNSGPSGQFRTFSRPFLALRSYTYIWWCPSNKSNAKIMQQKLDKSLIDCDRTPWI